MAINPTHGGAVVKQGSIPQTEAQMVNVLQASLKPKVYDVFVDGLCMVHGATEAWLLALIPNMGKLGLKDVRFVEVSNG